LLVFVKLKAYS